MPSRLPLKAPERDPDRARNLSHSAEIIARLKRQIPNSSSEFGLSIPPVHGTPGTVAPTAPIPKEYPSGPNRPTPDPSKNPGMPGTNLSGMPPALMARFLSERSDQELRGLLAAETAKSRKLQDDRVVAKLYREIKTRGA